MKQVVVALAAAYMARMLLSVRRNAFRDWKHVRDNENVRGSTLNPPVRVPFQRNNFGVFEVLCCTRRTPNAIMIST